MENDVLYIVKTAAVQNFKDENEINNRTYLITKEEINFIYEDWDFTDYTEDEILKIQSDLKDDETAIIVMSDCNYEGFIKRYFP